MGFARKISRFSGVWKMRYSMRFARTLILIISWDHNRHSGRHRHRDRTGSRYMSLPAAILFVSVSPSAGGGGEQHFSEFFGCLVVKDCSPHTVEVCSPDCLPILNMLLVARARFNPKK